MIKKKHYYFHLVVAFIIALVAVILAAEERNIIGATAQIESNSTFTTCINGKCVTTTTICIINQPCHTVKSNSTNVYNNNSTGNNNIITAPFPQGTI